MGRLIRILTVFGTRPEAIKMAPVIRAIERTSDTEVVVCVTGQHREMLQQVLDAFSVVPDYDLDIMRERQTLEDITARTLTSLRPVIADVAPDVVMVHGDTSTSVAAALSAFYHQVPVAHVEAGLRTHRRYSPFPEEMNRTLIADLATYHFAPTADAAHQLAHEGIDTTRVWITGNTALDAFAYTLNPTRAYDHAALAGLSTGGPYVLVTAHRRENLGAGIAGVCAAVTRLAAAHPERTFVYPVHLNPAVRDTVMPALADIANVLLTDPLGVVDLHNLLASCDFVMTDSGGIQEEASFLHRPVLVLRDDTERGELVELGAAELVGTDPDAIVYAAERIMGDAAHRASMETAPCPYGDGHASERIVEHLVRTIREDAAAHDTHDTHDTEKERICPSKPAS